MNACAVPLHRSNSCCYGYVLLHVVSFGLLSVLVLLCFVAPVDRAFKPVEGLYLIRTFRSWVHPAMAVMPSVDQTSTVRAKPFPLVFFDLSMLCCLFFRCLSKFSGLIVLLSCLSLYRSNCIKDSVDRIGTR